MARIEIDETDFQNSQKLRATIEGILKTPGARRKLLEAQKEAYPDTAIPELDSAQPVLEAVQQINKKFEDFTAAQKKERAEEEEKRTRAFQTAKWEAGRRRMKGDHKYTDEGLTKLEEMMVAKGIADHDDARLIFEKINPPPTPAISSTGSGPWEFMGGQPDEALDKDFKALIESRGTDERAVNNLINSALNEVRGAGR